MLTLLLNCTSENLDRVLYKLIENSFEKLTRLYKNIFERWLQPMAEYDLRLFKSAEEVNYLRADFPQFDLLVTVSIVLMFLCKQQGRAASLTEMLLTYSFQQKLSKILDVDFTRYSELTFRQFIRMQRLLCADEATAGSMAAVLADL